MKKDKLYFAKYILVEGEIKEGESVIDEHKTLHKVAHIGQGYIYNTDMAALYNPKKVKLFLCSRDNPEQVLGEVSDKAVWVKEGDEFDENEIELWGHTITPNTRQAIRTVGFDKYKEYMKEFQKLIVKIKGPCGHFH